MKKIFILSLLFLSVSCHMQNFSNKRLVERIPENDGLTEEKMIIKLGKPVLNDSFPLSKANDEMRYRLQNHFKKSDQNSPIIIIRELWWEKDGYYITCWFRTEGKNRVVFESIRWYQGTRF